MNVELLLFKLVPSDLVQYPVVVEVGPRVKPSKHLISALRRVLRWQFELILFKVVRLEVLNKLALVAAKRVQRDEVQDATRADKVQDVDFTFQSVVGFFEELAAHFVPLITVLLFNTATPATDKHAAGHDVLPVVILKLPAI